MFTEEAGVGTAVQLDDGRSGTREIEGRRSLGTWRGLGGVAPENFRRQLHRHGIIMGVRLRPRVNPMSSDAQALRRKALGVAQAPWLDDSHGLRRAADCEAHAKAQADVGPW